MSDRLDEFVREATERLKADRELRWDVSRELRAHLEDAAEAARAQGLSEEAALDEALKRFGDRAEVAEQLWQANRARMRLHAAARWANRLVLLPAAVVVGALLFVQFVQGCPRFAEALSGDALAAFAGRREWFEPRRGLSEKERDVLAHLTDGQEDALHLAQRYPNDPLLLCNAMRVRLDPYVLEGYPPSEAFPLEEVLRMADRGEELEPGNSFYNYVKAAALMEASSDAVQGEGPCFSYSDRRPGPIQETRRCGARLVIRDRATFERAVGEVREGIGKPCWTSHVSDIARLRRDLAAPPQGLGDVVFGMAVDMSSLLPHLRMAGVMNERLPGYALLLAEEGRTREAADWAAVLHRPAVQMGAGSQVMLELLGAQQGLLVTAGQRPAVYEALGMSAEAARAREFLRQSVAAFYAIGADYFPERQDESQRRISRYGGVVLGEVFVPLPGWEGRGLTGVFPKLEHLLLEELALDGMAGVLALFVVAFGVLAAVGVLRGTARDEAPTSLSVGWRRLGKVLLLGVALPVAAYALVVRAPWLGSYGYGLDRVLPRRLVELAVLWDAFLLSVVALAYGAVRARCRDAGLGVPEGNLLSPFHARRAALTAVLGPLLATAAALGAALYVGSPDWLLEHWLAVLVASVALLFPLAFVAWQVRHLGAKLAGFAGFRRALLRSIVPVLAVSLLAFAVMCQLALRASTASQMHALARLDYGVGADLELSDFGYFRDYLRELDRAPVQTAER